MQELVMDVLVPLFTRAGTISLFMTLVAKGLNMLAKAINRGEVVV